MRWSLFIIAAFVLLVLETGLRGLLVLPGDYPASPSFLLALVVFVALSAPRRTAMWAAMVLGLLVDLNSDLPLGSACLGYLAAALVAFELRGLVFRDSPPAIALMVFVAGILAHLVTVALLTLRGVSWLPADAVVNWSVSGELVQRFLIVLYSAAFAWPLGSVFVWLDSLWRFDHQAAHTRRKRIT